MELIYLNSSKRSSGSDESYTIQLPGAITRVKKIAFIGTEIPATFYTFNNITASFCTCNGREVAMFSGYYEDYGACTAVNAAFTALGFSTTAAVSGNYIRLTIANGEQIVINNDVTNGTLAYNGAASMLGFTTSTTVTGSTTYTAPTTRTNKYQKFGSTGMYFAVNGSPTQTRISPGNYTPTALAAEMQSKIASGLTGISSVSVTYSSVTFKLTITIVKTSAFTTMTFSTSSPIAEYIGLSTDISALTPSTTLSGTCSSAVQCDIPYLLIQSNVLANRMAYKPLNNVVCKIPVPSQAIGSMIYYSDEKNVITMAQSTTLTYLDFYITDHLGRYIKLGGSWSLGLRLVTQQ